MSRATDRQFDARQGRLAAMAAQLLDVYNRKRNFTRTPEPRGRREQVRDAGSFVIQKHAARRLHYDFRLEWEGVLRSWAVPKGPSLDPTVKRMAVQVEDHPLSYGDFEGTIPQGQYGAGSVIVWDRGTWTPIGDAARGFAEGKLKFTLQGRKLNGGFTLVRMRQRSGEKGPSWLLIKERDAAARPTAEFDVLEERSESVAKAPRKGRRASLPLALAPQLATLVASAPAGEWDYELKLDGYRLLTRVDGKDVRCFTRNGHDWSSRLPGLVKAVRALDLGRCWLDGEIVVADERGAPDFQRLQNAFDAGSTAQVQYLVFDLPFHEAEDLRQHGVRERRERLRQLLGGARKAMVQFSPTLKGEPAQLLRTAGDAGFEGLVGKRAEAPYHSGRNRDWIKLKTGARQEFVVGGFTDPQGSRSGLGSLLLGVHDTTGKLRYAGNVGTGFSQATLEKLRKKLGDIETAKSPFEGGPKRVGTVRRVVPHWVRPKLVAEVAFAGWTADGHVRQAVFNGLRDDKPPEQIIREAPRATPASAGRRKKAKVSPALPDGLRITHPERVIDATTGLTKGDLIAYYAQVAPLLLPHLRDRPVALLRAPDGVEGGQFFQKHAQPGMLPKLERLDAKLDPGNAPLLVIPSTLALLSAAQMNVVELHTWNATSKAIETPDRLVFDLDPGEGVKWGQVREAAHLVHALLEQLKLRSFLKTSGGKGLHVVLPLKPQLGWDEAKGFSQHLVQHLAKVIPQRFVAKSGPANRVGRIFVDYLRNGRGATTASAWSARVRPGMGISVPLAWDELPDLPQPPVWSVADFAARLSIGNKPWKDYEKSRQSLTAAMRAMR
jgi:bifunctional non-homologous end joining protein LigD